MAKQSKNSRQRVSGAVMEEKCLRLRIAGMSYSQIGKEVGCCKQNAHRAVTKALAETRKRVGESAEQLRDIELKRLDALWMAMWSKAQTGDARAADTMIRVMKRRASMLGLDAPKKVEGDITGALEVVAPQLMDFGKVTIKF